MKKITKRGIASLRIVWGLRLKLRAEGDKLWAEGDKLRAEGSKLRAEGDRLRAEGSKLWAEKILKVCGNIAMDWRCRGNGFDFHLDAETVFRWDAKD